MDALLQALLLSTFNIIPHANRCMYMIQEYKSPVKTYLESVQEKGIFSFLAFAVQKSPQKEAGTDEA